MSFAIKFNNKPAPKSWLGPGEEAELAEIIINDFIERLAIGTNFWSRDDYILQWKEAIKAISANSDASSVFITNFRDNPDLSYAAELWPLYRKGETVFIQNYYASPGELKYPLTKEGIYQSLRKRSRGGSEWEVPLSELQAWAAQLENN